MIEMLGNNGKATILNILGNFTYFVLFLTIFLAACQPEIIEAKPPDINYGQDICDRCGMIIGEARFASATQLKNGKYMKFDDTGEMFDYYASNSEQDVIAWWVHDYLSEEWFEGKSAFYVKSSALVSPMGSGIASFVSEEAARQFANEQNAEVYTFDEIRKLKPAIQ